MSQEEYIPTRAMVIVAHPDDIEFGCGGTVAHWVKQGASICYVLCTSGDVGIAEQGMTKAKATAIREAEQLEAAEVMGVTDVVFLREPDGLLEDTIALRKKLVREIRRFRPEAVITEDPLNYWRNGQGINHPDHRAAGIAAINAIFPAASQPNLFEELWEEGLTPHSVHRVYVQDFYAGTHFIDVSDAILIQIDALKKHVSQVGDRDLTPDVYVWTAQTGQRAGLAHAESYRLLLLTDDEGISN